MPQEVEALHLSAVGLTHSQIEAAMQISAGHLNTLFWRAKARGYDVPARAERKRPSGVSTKALLLVRARLLEQDASVAKRIYVAIANELGCDPDTARMRLTRYDKRSS